MNQESETLTDFSLVMNCIEAGADGWSFDHAKLAQKVLSDLEVNGKEVTAENACEVIQRLGYPTPADWNRVVIL